MRLLKYKSCLDQNNVALVNKAVYVEGKEANTRSSTLPIKAEICCAVLNDRAGVCPLSDIQLPRCDLSE